MDTGVCINCIIGIDPCGSFSMGLSAICNEWKGRFTHVHSLGGSIDCYAVIDFICGDQLQAGEQIIVETELILL